MHDPLLGTEVGNYRLIRVLGEGGMGRVYVGEQAEIASRVAIKVLSTRDPDLVARFFAEARAVNMLKHPGLVKVHALAHLADGRPYIIMELVEGETLRALVERDSPLPISGVLDVMKQLLACLGAAHAAGVVHRDLKPDNVMVTPDGAVKVLDFGIAKLSAMLGGGLTPRTQTGSRIGTPAYMAPEQIRGGDVDARTDVYAAGVLLFEAITGKLPFDASSEFELMRGHLEIAPPSLAVVRRDVPPTLDAVVMQALAKAPGSRFLNASAMAAAIEQVRNSLPPGGARLIARPAVSANMSVRAVLDAERATRDDRAPSQPTFTPPTVDVRSPSQPTFTPPTVDVRSPSQPTFTPPTVDVRSPSQPDAARRFPPPTQDAAPSQPRFPPPTRDALSPSQPRFPPPTQDVARERSPTPPLLQSPRAQPSTSARWWLPVASVAALGGIAAAAYMLGTQRSAPPAPRVVEQQTPAPVTPAPITPAPITPAPVSPGPAPAPIIDAAIHRSEKGDMRVASVDEVIDGAHFNVITNISKAEALAHQLLPKLQLAGISISSAHADGSIDIDDRMPILYRFAVPGSPTFPDEPGLYCNVAVGVDLHGWRATTMRLSACARPIASPTCGVADVWKRAIAKGADAKSPASLEWIEGHWEVVVRDTSQKVIVPDGCAKAATIPVARAVTTPTPVVPSPQPVVVGSSDRKSFTKPYDFDPKHFDVVEYLPKARALARTLVPDAQLVTFSVDASVTDGMVDVTSYGAVIISYSSSRTDACTYVGVVIGGGQIMVSSRPGVSCSQKPTAPPRCHLRDIMAHAKSGGTIIWTGGQWYLGTQQHSTDDDCP